MSNQKNKNTLLQLFNMLDEGEYSKKAILENLNISKASFYKNLGKIKTAGFEVAKMNNIYFFKKCKNVLALDESEKSTIAYMLNVAMKYLPEYKFKNFEKFINRLLLLAKEKDRQEVFERFNLIKKYSLIEEYEEKVNTLEFYILQNKKITATLRSQRNILMKPIRFEWRKENALLYYMNLIKNQEEKIKLDLIAKIKEYDEKDYIKQNEEVIFELYGDLAKRYLLKKDERIVKNTKNSIIIASGAEKKEILFKRLLRYDTLCKILFPKSDVENFNKLIDKAIANLNSAQQDE